MERGGREALKIGLARCFYTLTGNASVSILASSPLGAAMARLRDLSRITAAVVLSFGLTAASISNASTPGFGTVVSAQHAHVGRAAASVGTTVFSGDSLDTEELGSLQVRAGAARLLLPADSRVTLGTEEGTAAATLKNGTAVFSTANAKAFALHASIATIRANGDGPTVGSVSIVNPKELRVSCSRGTLAISVDDDTKTISEGTAYRVALDPDQYQQTSDGSAQNGWPGKRKGPKKSGKDKFLLFAIFGSAVVTGIALYFALESPDQP
jgi:hypothetical protein